jgi:hypothetical protein
MSIILEGDKKNFNKTFELAKEHLSELNYIYFYGYKNGRAFWGKDE